MIKQNNVALKTVLINYCVLDPIGNFITTTADIATDWNAAGEAAKTAAECN